jgi:[ribosomal protein S18]-alanine N-acetyltransferase
MPMTIRSAVPDDVPAILALEQQAASAAHWTRELYLHLLNGGLVLVAEEEGECSGFLCAKAATSEWEIENIVVGAQVRQRGIADALLSELLRRGQSEGCSAVWLEVRESNQPARRLYEKHGFRQTGRRPAYYGDPVEDAVLYEFRVASTNAEVGSGENSNSNA